MIIAADEYRICKKGRGLSTDQKPMDWDNGSFFYEMDTAQAVSDYLDEHLTNPTKAPSGALFSYQKEKGHELYNLDPDRA